MSKARSYITGLGGGGALLAAIGVAFATLVAVVAFQGLPGSSGSDRDDRSIVLENRTIDSLPPGSTPIRGAGVAESPSTPPPSPAGPAPSPSGDDPALGPGGEPGGPEPATDPADEIVIPPPPRPPPPPPRPPLADLGDEIDDSLGSLTGLNAGLGKMTVDTVNSLEKVVRDLADELEIESTLDSTLGLLLAPR